MKKFFILSNHFKNRLLEILSLKIEVADNNNNKTIEIEVVTRPYMCAGLSMCLFANTQQLIGKFLRSTYAFFGSSIFHHF